ncbi:hypothetical protein EIN_428010 [Entamoeba invadens IP1]|uniref:Uncharacterized protein n=1 Tax=Entamoeba invadens IP1 TaxID=370355 RepID=A0A0A1UEW9_ENTIV|nr:hypothetical protein EIN_428010 [Entamoeba invadens IP1]ELP95125.1 hypothetical protein EIN_428010 [Entamoeba invadens IP1]|eukprot:XP_004261896.1 hypothetical protein EIN_428010 [Entamoeba invadens IP1]
MIFFVYIFVCISYSKPSLKSRYFNYDRYADEFRLDDDVNSLFSYKTEVNDNLEIDRELTDEFIDEEMNEEHNEEYDLQFFFRLLYQIVADKDSDIDQVGVKRVESGVLKLEKAILTMEHLDRTHLIKCDEFIPKSVGATGNGEEADLNLQKANESKKVLKLVNDLLPQLKAKQKEILMVLPMRERVRLARRFDFRHRYDLMFQYELFL